MFLSIIPSTRDSEAALAGSSSTPRVVEEATIVKGVLANVSAGFQDLCLVDFEKSIKWIDWQWYLASEKNLYRIFLRPDIPLPVHQFSGFSEIQQMRRMEYII